MNIGRQPANRTGKRRWWQYLRRILGGPAPILRTQLRRVPRLSRGWKVWALRNN